MIISDSVGFVYYHCTISTDNAPSNCSPIYEMHEVYSTFLNPIKNAFFNSIGVQVQEKAKS